MNSVLCPHCGSRRILTTKIPKDVVVFLPCPSCKGLVVFFRGKAVGLNREIVKKGTREERRAHFAEIIDEFLDPGMFSSGFGSHAREDLPDIFAAPPAEGNDEESSSDRGPITEGEVERFVKVDLNRIDETAYFRKHFGD